MFRLGLSRKVHCVGQVIGAVLAESAAVAKQAAKLVRVQYEELPSLMTIEDAIAADRYWLVPFFVSFLVRIMVFRAFFFFLVLMYMLVFMYIHSVCI